MPRLKRTAAAVAAAATCGLLAAPSAHAALAAFNGTTASLVLDNGDNVAFVVDDGGVLDHGQVDASLESTKDWGSNIAGVQTAPSNGTVVVSISAGDGDDFIGANADIASVTLDGGFGDDVLVGAHTPDDLTAGPGDDLLLPGLGVDDASGDGGNDRFAWRTGDGNDDRLDGSVGSDLLEVDVVPRDDENDPQADDTIVIGALTAPGASGVRRTNGVPFEVETNDMETTVVRTGAGDDTVTTTLGVRVVLDGGPGDDTLTGGTNHDELIGGPGDDTLDGQSGNDTFLWRPGDGADTIEGGTIGSDDDVLDIRDTSTGAATYNVSAGSGQQRLVSTAVTAVGTATLDVTRVERLDLRGGSGVTTVNIGSGLAPLRVAAHGGNGNDVLNGGPEDDILLGGPGLDTLDGGDGHDVLDGGPDNDSIDARDGLVDIVRCGGGSGDTATADHTVLDPLEACETEDRTADPAPITVTQTVTETQTVTTPPTTVTQTETTPPTTVTQTGPPVVTPGQTVTVVTPAPAPTVDDRAGVPTLRSRTARVRSGRAELLVQCPAGEAGGCRGRITVRTAKAVSRGGVRAALVLGEARFALTAGARSTVRVRLAPGASRLAARRTGRLSARADVVSTDRAGNTGTATRPFVLAFR